MKKMFPARAQEVDVMYSVTGSGIQGEIIIMFIDTRVHAREMMEETTDNAMRGFWNRRSECSDDDSLFVSWVRWVPDVPFPVERMITKYGKPEKTEKVVMIDFSFTSKDYMKKQDTIIKGLKRKSPPKGWDEATPIESDTSAPGREEPRKKEVR